FLAMDTQIAQPQTYATFLGLVWLAVVVTLGIRSITAAALAGLSFTLFPGIFQTYVPTRWAEVPTALFGLGALGVARHLEGVVLQNGREIRKLLAKIRGPQAVAPAGAGEAWPASPESPVAVGRAGSSATPEAAP